MGAAMIVMRNRRQAAIADELVEIIAVAEAL